MKSAMLAVGLALGVASFAVAAQEPVIKQSEVRLVGCVEMEQAFRTKIRETAEGVGQSDMVLTRAKPAAGAGTPRAMSGDFILTGRLEAQLSTEVGRAVEIVGFIEDEATHDSMMARKSARRLFVKIWHPAAGACS